MSTWNWLALFGVPSIVGALIVSLWVQTKAIKRGVQALLRDRLLQGYKHYRAQGYADEDDRSNLDNIYIQYHALGKNGVMDDLHNKFLKLPIERKEEGHD